MVTNESFAGARHSASSSLTGVAQLLDENDIIVSKTDPKGTITYVNNVFLSISGYAESEMLGAPHSAIRHPFMPRAVFKFMWDTLKAGEEIFAYVINRCKNGDHWHLRHDSGLVFIEKLKKIEGASQIPVIVCSGVEHGDVLDLVKESGAQSFLTKPVSQVALSHEFKKLGLL